MQNTYKKQNGGLLFFNTNNITKKITSDKKYNFNINIKAIFSKFKKNNKLTLEELVLYIILKFANIENYHLIKDFKPRYYVKFVTKKEDKSIKLLREDMSKIDETGKIGWFYSMSNFIKSKILNKIDKGINGVSEFMSRHISDRYEIREDGILYKYSYEYIDKRTPQQKKDGITNKGISAILHPNIKLETGYYETTHMDLRIFITKKIVQKTATSNFNIIYNVFFFAFEIDKSSANGSEKYILYKNDKVVNESVKLEDVFSISIENYVDKNEESVYKFTQDKNTVLFKDKKYKFLVDYSNTNDVSLMDDIFKIIDMINKEKYIAYDLYNMYLFVLNNMDKYYHMSNGSYKKVFLYDTADIDKRMNNVTNIFKKIKKEEILVQGYANIDNIKFKDVRKTVLEVLATILSEALIMSVIYIPPDILLSGNGIFFLMETSPSVAELGVHENFNKNTKYSKNVSNITGIIKTISLVRILWNTLIRGSFILLKLSSKNIHNLELIYEKNKIMQEYNKKNKNKNNDILMLLNESPTLLSDKYIDK